MGQALLLLPFPSFTPRLHPKRRGSWQELRPVTDLMGDGHRRNDNCSGAIISLGQEKPRPGMKVQNQHPY